MSTRRPARLAVLALAALALAALLTGCGGGMDVERGDSALATGLRQLSRDGASGALADVTDFPWDTVHVFSEGASAAEVTEAVGRPVLDDAFYYDAGNLLVFSEGGEATRAVSVVPDLLVTGGQPQWSDEVVLEPRGQDTPAALRLVEPGRASR